MTSSHNSKPRSSDLTFWYTDSDKISTINIATFGPPEVLGSTVVQTHSGVLTTNKYSSKSSKKIGSFTEMKMCVVKTKDSAFVSNTMTFFLKGGNIQFQPVGVQFYNSQGYYGLPPDITTTFKIINGTGEYTFLDGYIVVSTFKNLDRLVKIYFTGNKN